MLKNAKTPQFDRFNKFVKWYMKLGGMSLTEDEINRTFPKFRINETR